MHPILSAMRRNKFGALLIAAQMAVTLAFLANALTLVEQRIGWSGRPSGLA
jgi:putative ABC transport system permease protein